MTEFEQNRIEELKKMIFQDYEIASGIKRIVNYGLTERTEDDFVNVYYRTLIDRVWFTDPGRYPAFGSLGGSVARGEISYCLTRLSERVGMTTLRDLEVTRTWLSDAIALINPQHHKLRLLASDNIYLRIIFNRDLRPEYNDALKEFEIEVNGFRIPVYPMTKDIMQGDVVLLNTDCCFLRYKKYHYPVEEMESTLSVEIGPCAESPHKMDVLVKSMIRFEIISESLVKIFNVLSTVGEPLIV